MMNLHFKEKERKVLFQMSIHEELDKRFRQYVFRKHGGYKKGQYSEAAEIALTNLIKSECK